MKNETMKSEEFLAGIGFMRKIGIPLDVDNIHKLVEIGESIVRPSGPVGEILAFLESAVDSNFQPALMEKLPGRIDTVLGRANKYSNDYDLEVMC